MEGWRNSNTGEKRLKANGRGAEVDDWARGAWPWGIGGRIIRCVVVVES